MKYPNVLSVVPNDDYTVMYKKRTELNSQHNVACEEFGGMIGMAIGSIPVVVLGLGKVKV